MLRSRWILLLTLGLTLPGVFCLAFSPLHWSTPSSAASAPASPDDSDDDQEDGQPPLLSSVLSPSRHRLVPPRRSVRTAARPYHPASPSPSPSQVGVLDTRHPIAAVIPLRC